MNKKQVAKLLGVSIKTIDAWVAKNKIPYVKCGDKLVRFVPEQLDQYVKANTIKNGNHIPVGKIGNNKLG